MIKYKVEQSGVETPIIRKGNYLTVYDGKDNKYTIRVNKLGGLEISTIGDDLKVVCKTSNSLIVDIDE